MVTNKGGSIKMLTGVLRKIVVECMGGFVLVS